MLMLFIGDIHITSTYKDKIIDALRAFVSDHASENHIVFLGDYVYHFSYDRGALLALYHFFVELFEQGKSVYVLAGNHDWLGNSFVFEEAQKAFSIFQQYDSTHKGSLKFITQPTHMVIDGKDILFYPFMLQIPEQQPSFYPSWLQHIEYLQQSSNKNEQLSWKINMSLAYFLELYPESLVVHHYYFNKLKLPGQKSLFSYKDVALTSELLDLPCSFVSGHLHQSCSYKNYLCTGSVWSTSPLEVNYEKFLFLYSGGSYKAYPIRINPYIQLETSQKLSQESLSQIVSAQQHLVTKNFTGQSSVEVNSLDEFPLSSLTLTLLSDQLDYTNMEEYVDSELFIQLGKIRLKKNAVPTEELLEKLTLASSDAQGFGDWKQLLRDYLKQKYSSEYNEYESILHELKVL